MKKLSSSMVSIFLLGIILTSFLAPCLATDDSVYVWSSNSNSINSTNHTENTAETIENEEAKTTNSENSQTKNQSEEGNNSLSLESSSAILIEQTTGQILYSHNIHESLRPASVTKIMSILLIMEAIEDGKMTLTDRVPCSENAASMGGSQIWLDPRETLSVDEMLKAICVNSANDCVVAMGEFIAGSEDAFVQMMNDRAQELGMKDTVFKNSHGLDEDGHVTSSYDISLMSRELLNNHPEITKYTSIWMDTLREGKSQLSNTNKLIKTYKGATGLKTGSTSLALYNLSASATREDLSLIAVIMKAPSTKVRFEEAAKLLDYGFNQFSFKSFGSKDEVVKTVAITKGVTSSLEVVLENNAGTIIEKGKASQVEQTITLDESFLAPIESGQKLGEATFTLEGKTLASVDLVAKTNVNKLNVFTMSKRVIYSWIDLLRS